MEPLRIEVQIGVVVLLTDDEPGDAVAKGRIQLRDDVGSRAVGGNDVLRPVHDLVARRAGAARLDEDVVRARLDVAEFRPLVDLGPARLHDVVVGVLAIDVRRRSRDERHRQLQAVGKQKIDAGDPLGRVERLVGRLAEVLAEERVPARREDAGADLVARQFLPLQDDRAKAGVHRALGRRGAREARADDEDVGVDFAQRRHSVMKRVSRPE